MNPSVDDRLNSVLRALQTVVLPALPDSASLAREQVMLAMGQIQIIQAQRDYTPTFEQGELDDLLYMARAILALDEAPVGCAGENEALAAAVAQTNANASPRQAAEAIRAAIDALLIAARSIDEDAYQAAPEASWQCASTDHFAWQSAVRWKAAPGGCR